MNRTNRILFLTDLHLRSDYIPGYLKEQVKTLKKLVNTKPPDALVIGGDIFHKRNPEGEELLAFDAFLSACKCKNIFILRGNHDSIRKDGSSDTTLSLFKGRATVIKDTSTVSICNTSFDFVPHYEDPSKIVEGVKKAKNHLVGHFGFQDCISNGNFVYESDVKAKHFPKKKLSFLGHIHKPKVYGNIHVLGTPYSTSFGEANAQKWVTEMLIRDQEVSINRKPINFGIRHLQCGIDELPSLYKKLGNDSFFTLLRVKLDRLDEYVERQIHDKLVKDYDVDYLEFSFEDILPKFTSDYVPDRKILSLDDEVISDYINSKTSVFSKDELLKALNDIKNNEN